MVAELRVVAPRTRPPSRERAWLYWTGVPLAIIVVTAFLVPVLFPVDLGATDLANRMRPPVFAGGSWEFPLGTDALGRDLLMRTIVATRASLTISLAGMLIASVIGMALGLAAGLWGRHADAAITFIIDVRLSLPGIVITTAAMAFFGSTTLSMVLIIGLTGWAGFARIVRGEMLSLRETTFMEASRAIGSSRWRIIREHSLVNMASLMIVNAALQLNGFILLESSLSFLGLGVQPPDVSLGLLVADGREYLMDAWWMAIVPSIVIMLVIFLVTMLGDWLRDRFDPKVAQRR